MKVKLSLPGSCLEIEYAAGEIDGKAGRPAMITEQARPVKISSGVVSRLPDLESDSKAGSAPAMPTGAFKPAKKKANRRRKGKGGPIVLWTEQEVEKLIDGIENKKSVPELAHMLRRSERAIAQKMVKLRNAGMIA